MVLILIFLGQIVVYMLFNFDNYYKRLESCLAFICEVSNVRRYLDQNLSVNCQFEVFL